MERKRECATAKYLWRTTVCFNLLGIDFSTPASNGNGEESKNWGDGTQLKGSMCGDLSGFEGHESDDVCDCLFLFQQM